MVQGCTTTRQHNDRLQRCKAVRQLCNHHSAPPGYCHLANTITRINGCLQWYKAVRQRCNHQSTTLGYCHLVNKATQLMAAYNHTRLFDNGVTISQYHPVTVVWSTRQHDDRLQWCMSTEQRCNHQSACITQLLSPDQHDNTMTGCLQWCKAIY